MAKVLSGRQDFAIRRDIPRIHARIERHSLIFLPRVISANRQLKSVN